MAKRTGGVTFMQVQGTAARVDANPGTVLRPLSDLGCGVAGLGCVAKLDSVG